MTQKIKVWDFPVRLFHWLTLVCVCLLWWSAEQGEMVWHQLFAYVLMINLLLRIAWGLVGSQHARFGDFVTTPSKVLAYLRQGHGSGYLGHNPVGGYMVIALMLLLLLQLLSGMFATDEIFTEGPWYSLVSDETAQLLTWLHKRNFNVLQLLVAVHVAAVLFYEVRGHGLIGSMISGNKRVVTVPAAPEAVSMGRWWILLLLIASPIVYWLIMPLMGRF
ncbi:cytochrome b/b6 domain-containing protein [Shewanella sp. YIC-542]|uniref:cytochrome b/b6 domain-containing protein n=1 Tax=Shewanella mytili TaxID=3377111 RepID=UPI00398EEEC4